MNSCVDGNQTVCRRFLEAALATLLPALLAAGPVFGQVVQSRLERRLCTSPVAELRLELQLLREDRVLSGYRLGLVNMAKPGTAPLEMRYPFLPHEAAHATIHEMNPKLGLMRLVSAPVNAYPVDGPYETAQRWVHPTLPAETRLDISVRMSDILTRPGMLNSDAEYEIGVDPAIYINTPTFSTFPSGANSVKPVADAGVRDCLLFRNVKLYLK